MCIITCYRSNILKKKSFVVKYFLVQRHYHFSSGLKTEKSEITVTLPKTSRHYVVVWILTKDQIRNFCQWQQWGVFPNYVLQFAYFFQFFCYFHEILGSTWILFCSVCGRHYYNALTHIFCRIEYFIISLFRWIDFSGICK